MIHIELVRTTEYIQSIRITGHANSASKGEDLVCAAISSMATGALNGLEAINASAVNLIYQEKPDALISIHVRYFDVNIELALKFLLIQLKTVEEAQSKYIQIQEVSV